MSIRVIGAGVGRTGTASLKAALEMLLGGHCYHMYEVSARPDDIRVWHQAALGKMPDWHAFLQDWTAAVDWPASAHWHELARAFPEALIVLSYRDAESWWESASNTIFPVCIRAPDSPWRRMTWDMLKYRFTDDIENRGAAIAAYEAHNAHVRAAAPKERLIEWQASDGWAPLCSALAAPVPDTDFPCTNTAAEFRRRIASSDLARHQRHGSGA